MIVRTLTAQDPLEEFGRIVLASYRALPGWEPDPHYEAEVADVAARIASAEVIGVFSDDGEPLGCVTYVPDPANPLAETGDRSAVSFRMFGIAPAAQGTGAGRALLGEVIARAVASPWPRLAMHTTTIMTRAHALYERQGFRRAEHLDWEFEPGFVLIAYVLELDDLRRAAASA
jgi:GNAT superfamily N-acetyltransferase